MGEEGKEGRRVLPNKVSKPKTQTGKIKYANLPFSPSFSFSLSLSSYEQAWENLLCGFSCFISLSLSYRHTHTHTPLENLGERFFPILPLSQEEEEEREREREQKKTYLILEDKVIKSTSSGRGILDLSTTTKKPFYPTGFLITLPKKNHHILQHWVWQKNFTFACVCVCQGERERETRSPTDVKKNRQSC